MRGNWDHSVSRVTESNSYRRSEKLLPRPVQTYSKKEEAQTSKVQRDVTSMFQSNHLFQGLIREGHRFVIYPGQVTNNGNASAVKPRY